jgi:hypothetical protein
MPELKGRKKYYLGVPEEQVVVMPSDTFDIGVVTPKPMTISPTIGVSVVIQESKDVSPTIQALVESVEEHNLSPTIESEVVAE